MGRRVEACCSLMSAAVLPFVAFFLALLGGALAVSAMLAAVGLASWPGAAAVALALGACLFAFAGRAAKRPAGLVLLLAGAAVFGVRLTQPGPYAAPVGADLVSAIACAGVGLWLLRGERTSRLSRAVLAVAPVVLLFGVTSTLHEFGEVVVLRTTDAQDAVFENRIWVLDHQGAIWQASGEHRRWFRRLAANPRVELLRGGAAQCHIATIVRDRDTSREVRARIERKYPLGRLLAFFGVHQFVREDDEPGADTALRFDPCPEP
jgi:hypothetical protein